MIWDLVKLLFIISLNSSLYCSQATEESASAVKHPSLPQFIKRALLRSQIKENTEQVRMFLEDDPRNVEATDDIDQSSLLTVAARLATATTIQDILAKKPDLNRQNMRERTAIMCATVSNSLAAVKALARAFPDFLLKDAEDQTVLQLAQTRRKYGNSKARKTRFIHEFIEQETTKYANTEQAKAAYETGTINLNALSLPEADSVTLQFLGDTEKMSAIRAKKRRKLDSDKAKAQSESVIKPSK